MRGLPARAQSQLRNWRRRIDLRAWLADLREDLRADVALRRSPFVELQNRWRRSPQRTRLAVAIGAAVLAPIAVGVVGVAALKVMDATERLADAGAPDPRAAAATEWTAGRWAQGPAPAPSPVGPARPDALAGQPPETLAWLTAPTPDASQPLVLFPFVTPESFCAALAGAGLPGAAFRADEPPGVGWTCVTDLIKPVPGPDDEASSLFVSARGFKPNSLNILRFKLNLLDPAGTRVVKRRAREALRTAFELLGFRAAEAPLAAIEELKDQMFTLRGVTYELRREYGTPLRVNMIVTFPRTLGAAEIDAFGRVRRPLLAPPRPEDAQAGDDGAPL